MHLTIKAAAKALAITEKTLYKRIKSKDFNEAYVIQENGKTYITNEGLESLKNRIRNIYTVQTSPKLVETKAEEEVAATVIQLSEKQINKVEKSVNDESNKLVIPKHEYDLLKTLQSQVEFLTSQLEKQADTHYTQMDTQARFYQGALDSQILSSENSLKMQDKYIDTMHEIVKNEQANTKAILDYDARSREIDDKLLKLRESMLEKHDNKQKKGLFSFFK